MADEDELPMPPEEIMEIAYEVIAELQDEGVGPGTSIKVLTAGICMILQNAMFAISKDQIAKDVTKCITSVAAKEQAEDEQEETRQ